MVDRFGMVGICVKDSVMEKLNFLLFFVGKLKLFFFGTANDILTEMFSIATEERHAV